MLTNLSGGTRLSSVPMDENSDFVIGLSEVYNDFGKEDNLSELLPIGVK